MNNNAKIKKPICIRYGDIYNIILGDSTHKEDIPLNPGALVGGNHYGFVLITDVNGKQKEHVYPTINRVCAICGDKNSLRVYEEDKKMPWIIDKYGNVKHSPIEENNHKPLDTFDFIVENYDIVDEAIFKNPIKIKISNEECVILKSDLIDKNYPLNPGLILGTEHYGFIVIIDPGRNKMEYKFPTKNKISAIVTEGDEIKIYEEGKYNPWKFTIDGKLIDESSYNRYSIKDKEYASSLYNLDKIDEKGYLVLKKTKDKIQGGVTCVFGDL